MTTCVGLPVPVRIVYSCMYMHVYINVCFLVAAEKRTTDSQVSGSINVNLSARVDNDIIMAPFHDQYMRLHEVCILVHSSV